MILFEGDLMKVRRFGILVLAVVFAFESYCSGGVVSVGCDGRIGDGGDAGADGV